MKKRVVEGVEVFLSSGNVYADLGLAEAEKLKVKTGLVLEIRKAVRAQNLTQQEAAKAMGLTQPKVSAMMNGDFNNLSERKLMDCLTRLGYNIEINVRPARAETGTISLGVQANGDSRKSNETTVLSKEDETLAYKTLTQSLDNQIRAIEICLKNGLRASALILIYSTIDSAAWLSLAKGINDVTRVAFIDWVSKYLIAQGFDQCPSTDLYSARCALVHTNSAESALTRSGKASVVLYAWGNADRQSLLHALQLAGYRTIKVVHVDSLLKYLKDGIKLFLKDQRKDTQQWQATLSKSMKMFEENPELDQLIKENATHMSAILDD